MNYAPHNLPGLALMGGIQRQVERAGIVRAKEMSMLGRRYDAATMEKWNIINHVVEREE